MCGIYGTTRIYSKNILQEKMNSFRFRGPNYQSTKEFHFEKGELTLGHNRLAIIDLESRSNQPFSYGNSIHIVFNGEIYNYKELKETYFSDKVFKTSSDTEVLCAMYERFGLNCLPFLNGMFSFVIYDEKTETLFGARDRLGKKPFYYSIDDRGLEFASQLSTLLIGNKYHIDTSSRIYYLMYRCIQEPDSIIKEIKTLRAGNYFTYNLKKQEFKTIRYWDINSNSCGFIKPLKFEEAVENIDFLLKDSIQKRLVADVPIGVFLSGGVDSSLIATYISHINKDITAYSIGFDDRRYDETDYSQTVARNLGIQYEKIICDSSSMLGILNRFNDYFDEPFADDSAIPTSLLCEKSKQFITVALGGDGADELFCGYNRYTQIPTVQAFYMIPRFIRKNFLSYPIKLLKGEKWSRKISFQNTEIYGVSPWNCYENAELFDYESLVKKHRDFKYLRLHDNLKKFSDFDIKAYLNNDINVKTDRASMRSALELRSPFMDYRIAEYSRLLPIDFLINKEWGQKAVLRSLLYQHMDRKIFERKKQGFSSPISGWLQNELKKTVIERINETTLGLLPELDSKIIISMRNSHLAGKRNYGYELWTLFMYMTWYHSYKQYIDF